MSEQCNAGELCLTVMGRADIEGSKSDERSAATSQFSHVLTILAPPTAPPVLANCVTLTVRDAD